MLVRTGDLRLSATRALPLLFIGMCTFIVNDIDDIERDEINHPGRPLPSGQVAPALATFLYFSCLTAALFTTRRYASTTSAFLYYLLLVTSISYGYVVDYFPTIKTVYVAGASIIPVLIVLASFPAERHLLFVAAAAFLFTVGREACKDLRDRRGDAPSLLHTIAPNRVAVVAFLLQVFGALALTPCVSDVPGLIVVVLLFILLALAASLWFRQGNVKNALAVMKVQYFVGLYFLLDTAA